MTSLLTPLTLGALSLPHRIFMAPLTRMRADPKTDCATPLMETYYRQRATFALIVTEATQISPQAKGYFGTPGIYTADQSKAWRQVVEAVHAEHGRIVLQLWHVGRISHHSLLPGGSAPLAPSALTSGTTTRIMGPEGTLVSVPCSTPQAMSIEDIKKTIRDYTHAASLAKKAGFDGIELHAAHGYLLHQFLSPESNRREDAYGGSFEKRARLMLEVLEALGQSWPSQQIGIRLSPTGAFNGLSENNTPFEDTLALLRLLEEYRLAYVHLSEPDWVGGTPYTPHMRDVIRNHYSGPIVAAGQYTFEKAEEHIQKGWIDAVAFGRLAIANPDLPERFRKKTPLNVPQKEFFYEGGARGYTEGF